jgi:heme/copper-type cytochrome/quinol oxidase subunit 2
MDLVSIFSTIVLVTTVATLVMAIVAYFAYKLREWRKPKAFSGDKISSESNFEPVFMKRFVLGEQKIVPNDNSVK